ILFHVDVTASCNSCRSFRSALLCGPLTAISRFPNSNSIVRQLFVQLSMISTLKIFFLAFLTQKFPLLFIFRILQCLLLPSPYHLSSFRENLHLPSNRVKYFKNIMQKKQTNNCILYIKHVDL
ncbi:hypothetical protein KOW79_000041, partial [Hemibagrus wyckioides]